MPAPDFYDGDVARARISIVDSVVALDISGAQPKMKWYYQILDTDAHDADPAMPPVLFDGTVNGQSAASPWRRPTRAGNFVVLDRTNGSVVHRLAGCAIKTGSTRRPTPAGHKACPNHGGGVEWNGGAYDPTTNYFIIPVTQECGVFFGRTRCSRRGNKARIITAVRRRNVKTARDMVNAVDISSGKTRVANAGALSGAGRRASDLDRP